MLTKGEDEDSMLGKENPKEDRSGIFQSCQWFRENPLRRWQFAVFLLFGLLTLLWLILRVTSSLTGDVLSGLCAFVLAVYGASHFRLLLGLKEQVDKFSKNNRAFKRENAGLKMEVSKLSKAQEELGTTADRLKETTQNYAKNISKFKALDSKLGKLAGDNIAGVERLREMSAHVAESIQKELVQHQRDILMRVQQSMEFGDDTEGMSQEEYERFVQALPEGFQERFRDMGTFDELAQGDDTIDMDEFTSVCDRFAEQEAVF